MRFLEALPMFLLTLSTVFLAMGVFGTIMANDILAWGNRVIEFDIISAVGYIVSAILVVFYLIVAERK